MEAPEPVAASSTAAPSEPMEQAPTEPATATHADAASPPSHALSHAPMPSPQPTIQYSPFPTSPMQQEGAGGDAASASAADSNRPAFSPMQISAEDMPALAAETTQQQQQHPQFSSPLDATVPASPLFAAGAPTLNQPSSGLNSNANSNGAGRRASKRAEDKSKLISTVRFNPVFAPPFSVESLKAQAAAAASVPPPPPPPAAAVSTQTACDLCPKRFTEFRFLHKHMHVMHGQPLDPAICPPAPSGTTFAAQLAAAIAACPPTLEPPSQLFITRSRLPANIRKNLAARRARLEKKLQRGDDPTPAPRRSAGGSGGGGAARGAAGGGGRGTKRKKKRKSLFGEYEGSTDEEESSYSSAEDRELDRMYDETARAYLEPKRLKKIERAKQRAAAKEAQAATMDSMTPEQRRQMELANFGVDSDDFSDLELSSEDEDDDDEANLPPEDDFDTDPDSKRSEIERMKLHASMELADRRAYDSTVQHEMNETYGFADSNPRTMVLSRDSVLVKLDLMDVLNNGILQYFSESQLETLKSLLPSCDRTAAGLSSTFISPFFIQSMYEYQELLMTGSLDPDMREMRNVVSSRRRREQTDVWKNRNYERYWGEALSSKGSKKDGSRAPPNIYWKPAAFKKEYHERQKMEGLLNRVIYGDVFAIRRRKQLLKAEGRWPLPSITELQAQRDSGLAAAIYVPRVIDGVMGVAPKPLRDDSKRKKYVRKGAQILPDAVSDEAITDAITASVKKKAAASAAAAAAAAAVKPHNIWEDGDDSKSNAANDDDSSSGGDHRGGAFEGEYDDGQGDGTGVPAAPARPPAKSSRRDRSLVWEDEFENPGEFNQRSRFPFAGPEDPDDDDEDEFELPVPKKRGSGAAHGSAPRKRPPPKVKKEPKVPLDPNAPPPDPNAPPPAPKPKRVRPPKDPNAPPRVKKEPKAPADPNAPPKEKKPRIDPRVCQNPDDPVEVARAAQVQAWVAAGLTTTGKARQKKKPKLEDGAAAGADGATPAVAKVVTLGDVQMAAAASAMPMDAAAMPSVAAGSAIDPAAAGAVSAIPMSSYGYPGYPAHYYSQMQMGWGAPTAAAAAAPAGAAVAVPAGSAATPATSVAALTPQQSTLWQQQQQQLMLAYQHQQAEQARQYKMIQDAMASAASASGSDGTAMTPASAAQLAYLQGMLTAEPGFLTQMQHFFHLQQQGTETANK